jgi:hypothetical protein
MLLLKLMQLRSSFGWSLSNLAAMLRMNLLTYRDLWKWLEEPYAYPASEPLEYALPLFANILDSKTGEPETAAAKDGPKASRRKA